MPAQAYTFSLNCIAIPSIDKRLYYATINNPLDTYDDIAVFRKTTQQETASSWQ